MSELIDTRGDIMKKSYKINEIIRIWIIGDPRFYEAIILNKNEVKI